MVHLLAHLRKTWYELMMAMELILYPESDDGSTEKEPELAPELELMSLENGALQVTEGPVFSGIL